MVEKYASVEAEPIPKLLIDVGKGDVRCSSSGLPGHHPCWKPQRERQRFHELLWRCVTCGRRLLPRTALWNRAHGLPSIEDKAKSQQYLTTAEEIALARYLIRMCDIGYPVPMKCICSLAFIVARQRSTTDVTIKPPGKNWPKAFEKRHPELNSRKVKAVDWNRHDNNI
jgi:hypothetical protein